MEQSTKRDIITIAGRPGSGKSSTAKGVAKLLDWGHFSSGDLFRAAAQERGIDVLTANLTAEQNADLDHLVDGKLRELNTSADKLVIDSRTAWHWIPSSFKVFLDLDLGVAAKRILKDNDKARQTSESIHDDSAEYAAKLQQRLDSESRRYKGLYDIDPYDTSNYDLVIDTAANDLDQVVQLVIDGFKSWSNEV